MHATDDDERVTMMTDTDLLTGLEHEVVRLFRTVAHAKMHAVHQGTVVDKAGYQVLHHLVEGGDTLRAKELACQVGIDTSTLSRHLSTLASAGLVERTPDPSDRRASLLRASADGLAVLASLRRGRTERLRAITSSWPDTDRAALVELLGRFNDGLDELADQPAPAS